MKKLIKFILLLTLFCFINVDALSCPYDVKTNLNQEVSHIKIRYDVKTAEFTQYVSGCDGEPENCQGAFYDYFDVSILNMTSNFYVVVTNNFNSERLVLSTADADEDGIIHFEHKYIMEKVTYTFAFYATDVTGCESTKIKTYTKAFPRKNMNHFEAICQDMPDADICQEFVFFDDMEYKSFYNVATKEAAKVEEAAKEKEKAEEPGNFIDEAIDFIIDYKWYLIGAGCLVAVAVFVVITKKKGDN